MIGSSSVLMLEFNELSPSLMARFIDEGALPNFRRLRDESVVTITDPQEPQSGLEPWIQWVTVHTGVPREEHGLEKLGEADQLTVPTIGQEVSEAGGSVWMCGSMNLPRRAAGGGWYLPDPWNPDSVPSPLELQAFSDFVRANVQEHSNPAADVRSPSSLARFGWFLARHGLRARTVRAVMEQLVAERQGSRGSWARASVLDRFQWDLFRWHWERDLPTFSTFFSNSTAHYQHLYWRNLEPDLFELRPSAADQGRYRDSIRFGYRAMDQLVGEAIDMVESNGATLMLCTGLSQQPFLQAEDFGGKYVYRPHDFAALVSWLGIEGVRQIAPVMAEQFHLLCDDERSAEACAEVLRGARVEGEQAMSVRRVGVDVFTGCCVHTSLEESAVLNASGGRSIRFSDLFYRSDAPKSGFHHPDGMWWIRTGTHREVAESVSLCSVAPTVLSLLGVSPPATMSHARVDLQAV